MAEIIGLYAGTVRALPPEGKPTGIYKSLVSQATIETEGLLGDHQADRAVHGGPEQAVHQYAQASYAAIVAEFPALADTAVPGSIGENVSAADMTEGTVYIGDTYQLGTVQLQVSQPRSPCWKINHRFDEPRLARFIADKRLNGWYYRVVKTGKVELGMEMTLLNRPSSAVSVDVFLAVMRQSRPSLREVERLQNCEGLSPEWQQRLAKKRSFLTKLLTKVGL